MPTVPLAEVSSWPQKGGEQRAWWASVSGCGNWKAAGPFRAEEGHGPQVWGWSPQGPECRTVGWARNPETKVRALLNSKLGDQ